MKLKLLGLVFLLSGCVVDDQSRKGVGFGNYPKYGTNSESRINRDAVQPPVAGTSVSRQGTGAMVARGGIPVYRYTGRNADKLNRYRAAQAALTVNSWGSSTWTRHEKTHALVNLAGHKLLAEQVYVGSHLFVVIRIRTFKHYMVGLGGGKKTLRKIVEDVANLTGCSANQGIYTGTQGYAVPIECS